MYNFYTLNQIGTTFYLYSQLFFTENKVFREKMKDKILKTNFKKPNKEIISNVTARPVVDTEIIKKLLIDQISSKVRWRESLLYMVENGVNEFIEIGPGKVLSGLAKRIGGNINVKSINTIEDIKSLK